MHGYALVRYKGGNARSNAAKPGGGATTCYGYLAKGAKWKTVEDWVVNPTNGDGLDDASVLTTLGGGVGKWETAASGANILGNGALTTESLMVDTAAPDALNEVYFGPVSDANAIAVTTVWGIFSGPLQNRKLVEWDQVYNTAYTWSGSGEVGKMDFDNIATHELGHSVGMADLYTTACSTQTMYGYASEGETNKRSLEIGDILGIDGLY